ncbi:hypothetical protein BKA61DRAFT_719581 [Leptodontidium sp. MPI-SDFR-AT-0119]|nr:hypothetical protein BKA61DRAFT_719581 [Leptodontidium sp. MPI-SDFR-AT-0119]
MYSSPGANHPSGSYFALHLKQAFGQKLMAVTSGTNRHDLLHDPYLTLVFAGGLWPSDILFQLLAADDARLLLADLELWVQDWLDSWLRANWDSPSTYTYLAELIKNYTEMGTSTYAGNPEDISLMLLTSMDLRVALDKCATRHEPLLSSYDPRFPPSLFTPLLLPKKLQMERLAHVEQHLTWRENGSVYGSSLIFQDIDARDSFAVQYFGRSQYYQDLRREIEAAAEIERDQKKREFREQRQHYNRLKRQSDDMSCEYITQWYGSRRTSYHDSGRCPKCRVKDTAERLEIYVHEWPLPTAELEARSAAVFELDVPTTIAKWRDITYTLLVHVLSPPTLRNSQRGNTIYYLYEFRIRSIPDWKAPARIYSKAVHGSPLSHQENPSSHRREYLCKQRLALFYV